MAQEENFFALLGDQETDDVSKLIDILKVEEPLKPAAAAALGKKKDLKPKQKFQMDPRTMRAKRIILPRHVLRSFLVLRKEKKDEPKPQENSLTTEPGKKDAQIRAAAATNSNVQQPSSDNGEKNKNCEGKSHPDRYSHGNGYQKGQRNYYYQGQKNYRVGNAYQGNYRNNYKYNNGVGDGYQGNYSRPDGYQVNGNNNNGGYRGGGRGGQGRGFQQRRRFYENNGNHEKEGQAVAYSNNSQNQQEKYFGKDQGQQYYGGYNRGQGPRGYYRRDGSKLYYNNGVNYNGDKKRDEGGSSNNGDNKNTKFAVVAPEKGKETAASNDGDSKKGDKKSKMKKSNKSKGVEDKSVNNKAEEKGKEKKLMTLKEYEETLVEKKKPLEALKKDIGERKVLANEEFGSMQMIEKKKDEKKCEEKKKDTTTSHSCFQEEKVHKSMSITEFLKPDGGRSSYYGQRPYWRVNNGRGNEKRNYTRQEEEQRPFYGGGRGYGSYRLSYGGGGGRGRGGDNDPHIEDLRQFPVLGLGRHGSA
ncbi:hypothetical protein REPUB_Repub15cG0095500 [Reevesia pubescens]